MRMKFFIPFKINCKKNVATVRIAKIIHNSKSC